MPPLRPVRPAQVRCLLSHRQAHPRIRFGGRGERRANHTSSQEPQPVFIQRTWNPFKTYRGPLFVAQFFAAYIIWARLSDWMLPDDLEDEEEEEVTTKGDRSPVQEDGVIDAEDQVFLPLWWPRMLPRAAFTNSDPTWQEFAKFSRDLELQKTARESICSMVLDKYGEAFRKALGGDLKIGRVWLDAIYPEGPPPNYSRPGLSIVDDGILLTEQIVPHAEYVRMRHLAYPGAFISAFRAAFSSYTALKTVRLKRALGFSINQHDHQVLRVKAQEARKMEQVDALRKAVQRQEQLNSESTKAGPMNGAGQSMSTSGVKPADSATAAPANSNSGSEQESGWSFPSLTLPVIAPPMTLDCVVAMQVGIQQWKRSWLESRRDHMPPGAMFFEGMVEIIGPSRRAKCALLAAYDPKQRKVVYVNPPTPLRVIDTRQRPKGGIPTVG